MSCYVWAWVGTGAHMHVMLWVGMGAIQKEMLGSSEKDRRERGENRRRVLMEGTSICFCTCLHNIFYIHNNVYVELYYKETIINLIYTYIYTFYLHAQNEG